MKPKINPSALLFAGLFALIYGCGWILFSVTCTNPVHFSMIGFFVIGFYMAAVTVLIYYLISRQICRYTLLLSRLKLADKTLESRVRQRTAELEAAVKAIKQLNGIIPICANCKSIRNGEGEWEQLEYYIQKHSDAKFSHGLCPFCSEKLYKDQYANGKTMQEKRT